MLELFVVRHGESIRNLGCLLAHQGCEQVLRDQLLEGCDEMDWPLTEKGRLQASQTGKWLLGQAGAIDAVFCSPYLRAKETAEGLHLGVETRYDCRLREREWGVFTPDAYSPAEYISDITECADFNWKSRFPGSESIHDLVPTTASFLADLRASHPQGTVVLVTHGGRMGAIEHVIEGSNHTRKYGNCSVLRYRFEENATMVRVETPIRPEAEPMPWQPVRIPVTIDV